MENLPSPIPEKAMHIITNDNKTLNTAEKDPISSQTATSLSILTHHDMNPEINMGRNLEDEKDVIMEDESEDKPSSLPPPLPVKQMVHITNYPLNDEKAVTTSKEPNTSMEVDASCENRVGNNQLCKQDVQDEEMDICNEPIHDNERISNNATAYYTECAPLIIPSAESTSTKMDLPLLNQEFNPSNRMDQSCSKNIIFDSSDDWIGAEEKCASNKTSYPDHFISSYSGGCLQPKNTQENKTDMETKIQGKPKDNSLKEVSSGENCSVNMGNFMDCNNEKNDKLSTNANPPGYTKNNIAVFGSTAHSNFFTDNKETLSIKINNTSDSNLNPGFGGKPITKARDAKQENAGVDEDNKKDYVSKNDDKKDQKYLVLSSNSEVTKNTITTSPTCASSSSKMVQSRTNSLSSTSPNSVTVQSLFLTTPMPYSKPTSILSSTTSSPMTNNYEVVNPSQTKSCIDNNDNNEQLVLGSDAHTKTSDSELSDLRQQTQQANTWVKPNPLTNNIKSENSTDHKVVDTRKRTNSVGFMKSRFESMDYTDASSETEVISTPEPSSSDDSTSQPNSLTGENVLMNVSRLPFDNMESGRNSSQGFSWNKTNQKVFPSSSSHLESNLTPNKKSSLKYRSTEGGHKKLSTVSLQEVEGNGKKVTLFGDFPDSTDDHDGDQSPLQRRNSIHNVPYVDVNDPSTRARMERYKEERRSTLRAKYKIEDYRSEKQQKSPSPSNSLEIESPIPSNESNTEKINSSFHSNEIDVRGSKVEPPVILDSDKVEVLIDNTKVQLRKLPIQNKRPNKLVDNNCRSHSPVNATNIIQAKNNSDRKWSMQTGVKQDLARYDSSPRPQHHKSHDSKSSNQNNRSSYPPQTGQIEDDVNVKERTAFWNGNKNSSSSNSIQKKDKRSSMTGKPTISNNTVHRKISEPASPYVKSSQNAVGKEKRVKSLSLAPTSPSTYVRTKSMDERSALKQSTKTLFFKDEKSDNTTSRQSTNIHLPSPNKIKNMAAFFEQNN